MIKNTEELSMDKVNNIALKENSTKDENRDDILGIEGSSRNSLPPTITPLSRADNNPEKNGNKKRSFIKIEKITGPLVIFFGPREIGKTTTLFRLCEYIEKEKNGSKYSVEIDKGFRTDKEYQEVIKEFERARKEGIQPDATGLIDFLLLNITKDTTKFCQILEAPGEHFFTNDEPDKEFESYFNDLLGRDFKKIFVFFFSIDMKGIEIEPYAKKINKLFRTSISHERDDVIIVCNKCDEQDYYMDNNRPNNESYKNELKKSDYIKLLFSSLEEKYGNMKFVPFMSGRFNSTNRSFALSDPAYPKNLWSKIEESFEGKSWSLYFVIPVLTVIGSGLVWFFKEIFPTLLRLVVENS